MNGTTNADALADVLKRHSSKFGAVFDFPLQPEQTVVMDFTERNNALAGIDLRDTAAFQEYVTSSIRSAGAVAGTGGYNEERVIYRRSPLFTDEQGRPRFIHLGVDLWVPAGTTVYAPLQGTVHSRKDNEGFGDYGPTIILRHVLEDIPFFTLYGHLSRNSLLQPGIQKGDVIRKGQPIGWVGNFPENGDWPPHLHVQLITDMLDREGDFTGVCSLKERAGFLQLCPDPT